MNRGTKSLYHRRSVAGSANSRLCRKAPQAHADSLDSPKRGEQPDRSDDLAPARIDLANFKGWQRERLRLQLRHCRAIERGIARGRSVAWLCHRMASHWRGRFYRSTPSRPVRLSAETIRRAYYRWRRAGRNASALVLRYRCRASSIAFSGRQRARVIRMLCDPSVLSFAQIHRAMFPRGTKRPSLDSFYSKFSAALRQRARPIFLARRQHRRTERNFARSILGKEQRT